MQKENKIVTFNALQNSKLELQDNFIIQIKFNSASMENEFKLEQESIVQFLRKKLNNYSLSFNVEIHHDETENFIKSKEEIFKEMIKENSILLKMKEKFGLDLNSAE
ncbi:MAG: hypothetical protein RBT46_00535 [Weeksellaceae bacterium]|nr:hypothetical protein [Weeksellaceae bacterium]